jgi:hypothetical protein
MSIKYTNQYLSRLELLLKEASFTIRYEKGNFRSGSCRLDENRIIVINKFIPVENKIHFLVELLRETDLDPEVLSEKSTQVYHELKQIPLQF